MNCRVFAFENADEVPNGLNEFHSVIWDGDLGGHLGRRKRTNPGNHSDQSAHILMVSTPQRHSVTGSDYVDFSDIWLKPVRSEEIEQALFPDLKAKFGYSVDDKISGQSETVRNNLSSERVLVVDDNKTNRLVAGKLLETVGIKVDFASNGLEALDLYQALRPKTIFMDVTMPVMDGIDATLHIRKLEVDHGLAPCKIFALTANTHKTQVELCMRSGVDGIIGIPVKRSDLIDAINSPNTAREIDVGRKMAHKLRTTDHPEMSGSPFQRGF
jgi:CheY-like chemotaxis protein